MTIVSIPITQAMRDEADRLAAKIAKTKTVTTRDNYTGLNMPGRYRNGFLGEFGVRQWFEDSGVRYDYHCRQDGRSDSGDFDVFRRGVLYRLDAKTSPRSAADTVMMPEAQFRVHRYDYYVAARLMEDQPEPMVDITGWAKLHEVWDWPVKPLRVLTRCQEYRLLNDPFELLEELDRR